MYIYIYTYIYLYIYIFFFYIYIYITLWFVTILLEEKTIIKILFHICLKVRLPPLQSDDFSKCVL